MTTYLQLHLLVSYPPSNLNRDDLGRPKTAIFGGSERLRISSQSLKRAWRTSPFFDALEDEGHIGKRTRRLGVEAFEEMCEAGISEEDATTWSKQIAATFAKTRKASKENAERELETEQLVHISEVERRAVSELVTKLAESNEAPDKSALSELLVADHKASDIAMFGRMLADNPSFGVEAAVQVSHAISTHRVVVEDDYFSAVDDLNRGDSGAGHIGEAGFASGLFYLYVNVDQDLLLQNLSGDAQLAAETLEALVRACAQVSPTGKQASFGSRCYAHYILAERGQQAPRQLSLAFLDGHITEGSSGPLDVARDNLSGMRAKMDRAYGAWASEENSYEVDVQGERGTFDELVSFVRGGLNA